MEPWFRRPRFQLCVCNLLVGWQRSCIFSRTPLNYFHNTYDSNNGNNGDDSNIMLLNWCFGSKNQIRDHICQCLHPLRGHLCCWLLHEYKGKSNSYNLIQGRLREAGRMDNWISLHFLGHAELQSNQNWALWRDLKFWYYFMGWLEYRS